MSAYRCTIHGYICREAEAAWEAENERLRAALQAVREVRAWVERNYEDSLNEERARAYENVMSLLDKALAAVESGRDDK